MLGKLLESSKWNVLLKSSKGAKNVDVIGDNFEVDVALGAGHGDANGENGGMWARSKWMVLYFFF